MTKTQIMVAAESGGRANAYTAIAEILATGKPTIESAVNSLDPFCSNLANLKAMGWSRRSIEAAVRRGILNWTRNGSLVVTRRAR